MLVVSLMIDVVAEGRLNLLQRFDSRDCVVIESRAVFSPEKTK